MCLCVLRVGQFVAGLGESVCSRWLCDVCVCVCVFGVCVCCVWVSLEQVCESVCSACGLWCVCVCVCVLRVGQFRAGLWD